MPLSDGHWEEAVSAWEELGLPPYYGILEGPLVVMVVVCVCVCVGRDSNWCAILKGECLLPREEDT